MESICTNISIYHCSDSWGQICSACLSVHSRLFWTGPLKYESNFKGQWFRESNYFVIVS